MIGIEPMANGETAGTKSRGVSGIRPAWWLLALVLVVAVVIFRPFQSHYIATLVAMGDDSASSYWGEPKDGRGDEAFTYLPILKQAAAEDFPANSGLAPYYENLDWFIAIPERSATLLFLPQHAVYFVVPHDLALSLGGLYYNLVLLFSIVWLLANLGVDRRFALAAALAVAFSHFYQVWWTSNSPSLALVVLPFAIVTSRLGHWRMFLLLTWALAHMLLSQMYPPFYLSTALCLAPVVLAIRPDLWNLRTLCAGVGAVVLAAGIYYFFRSDYISAVAATDYPGRRVSPGGGAHWSSFIGMLIPGWRLAADAAEPGVLALYEHAVIGTFFPMLCLFGADKIRYDAVTVRALLVYGVVLVCGMLYAVVGVPPVLAERVPELFFPGRRMQMGLSLTTALFFAWLAIRNIANIPATRALVAMAAYAIVVALQHSGAELPTEFSGYEYAHFVPLAGAVIASGIFVFSRARLQARPFVFGMTLYAGALCSVFVYGSFNPVLDARLVMQKADSPFLREVRQLVDHSGLSYIGFPGNFGHALRGEGLPVVHAIHLKNARDGTYSQVFGYLPADWRERQFNNFLGIAVSEEVAPIGGITATFPAFQHAPEFQHLLFAGSKMVGSDMRLISSSRVEAGPGSQVYQLLGRVNRVVPLGASIAVASECPVMSSWITRYPVLGSPHPHSGVMLRLEFDAELDAGECIRGVQVGFVDSGELAGAVAFSAQPGETGSWTGKACAVDFPASLEVRAGDLLHLDGYGISKDGSSMVAPMVVLVGDHGRFAAPAAGGAVRQDVADYFADARLARSGFSGLYSLSGVAAGKYTLRVADGDGTSQYCDTATVVEVIENE